MAILETGARIANRYVLQQRIGDGGHAEIWSAWDEAGEQRVALKFIHPEACSAEQAWSVLQHEAQMAALLDHPGVLRTGSPQRDGTRVFLPMEFAAGGDLKSLRGASYLRTVPILIEVAAILAHAHERGVVHRDVKPANVLFDANGEVRLADFGASARTGSTVAMAPGSPFTASPQQLAGEAAAPADDVYGLGALAYELLGGYPPFYPEFDLVRVQAEMPPVVRPVQPAPPRLTQLVMAMLARKAGQRPADMRQVLDELRQSLADTLSVEDGGGTLIEEAAAGDTRREVPRARAALPLQRFALVAAAAAVIGVGLLLVLPGGRDSGAPVAQRPQLEALPAAGAVLEPAAEAGLARAAEGIGAAEQAEQQAWQRELGAARLALSRGQPAVARRAFERADRIIPQTPEVDAGFAAVERLERVLALHSEGLKAETAGDRERAKQRFDAALALDPGFGPAQEARARVVADQQRVEREAAALAAQRERAAVNARDAQLGSELEAAERWADAATLYQVVLDRDATQLFAQQGLARSRERAALAAQLQDFIARPARLATPEVRREADRALAAGRAVHPVTPQLQTQLGQLTALLGSLDVEARVAITSDNSTRVSITRVGDLGVFSSRELTLRPGSYTIIGTRDGFRDVRRELRIAPGQREAALTVECTERI